MKLTTQLISGAGNTFHLTYMPGSEIEKIQKESLRKMAVQICAAQKADGFIFLSESDQQGSFKWTFFNNDGSDAEMCGNATRCVGYFIENNLRDSSREWSLETIAGKVKIFAAGQNLYRVIMSPFKKSSSTQGFFCDTGVPHLVIETSDADLFSHLDRDLKNTSAELRFHEEFKPKGTNVTHCFLGHDPKKIKAVSYERGVEDFTQACGTGAAAAAFFNLTKRGIQETEVEMPGGTLIMNLQDLNRPEMTGPAVLLGSYVNEVSI
ncbi:MAG: hypothetical protein K0R29_441 [Pseudobdellovibrio sp.]|jgi:diaminopimelate epimerase|nr:hypothetical protein [Pseudobdellovibrio sp.]